MNITEQKKTDQFWKDEAGINIPFNRINDTERFKEKHAFKIATKALAIQQSIAEFKEYVKSTSQEVLRKSVKAANGEDKERKGNFTWYNVDRSINERIEFDDVLIKLCKEKLDEFLKKNLTASDEFVKELVDSAFTNTKGSLDAKKVLSLLKHRQKIKNKLFQEALDLLEQSIRRPDSKTYYRVSAKDEEGKYKSIDLNFSSI